LATHGIATQVDLAGVGQNLQDHLLLPAPFRAKVAQPEPMFIAEAGLFVRTRPGMEAASPDLQYHFASGKAGFLPPELGPWFGFVPILAQPQSRGAVTLRSANPADAPVIAPNYLACEADIRVFLRGIALSRELAATKAFAEFNGGEIFPGANAGEPELRGFIQAQCRTVWHPVGTCKMGIDAMAVVNPQLRVYGVQGLRVADASIMPRITAGNTNAACIMIGEKAADLVRSVAA
jgi:choline dehydrogenase